MDSNAYFATALTIDSKTVFYITIYSFYAFTAAVSLWGSYAIIRYGASLDSIKLLVLFSFFAVYILIEHRPLWLSALAATPLFAYVAIHLYLLLNEYIEDAVWLAPLFLPHFFVLSFLGIDGHIVPYISVFLLIIMVYAALYDVFHLMGSANSYSRKSIVLHYIYFLINLSFIVIIFAKLYTHYGIRSGDDISSSIIDALYFSMVTWTTLGYGDFIPATLYGRVVVSVEVFMGMISMALLVAATISVMNRFSLLSEAAADVEQDRAGVSASYSENLWIEEYVEWNRLL